MLDILQMKGAKEAIDRIIKAVQHGERIILFADADVDGVASAIILKEALEILGSSSLSVYFANLEKDGYGLNKRPVNFLKNKAPALLIVLDCGIGNFEGVKLANELGFEVVIIDHHEILDKLPDTSIIIDPKQEKETDFFKEFCTAGIVYILIKVLMKEAGKEFKPERFLELAMLATLADLMPLKQENAEIVQQGLLSLSYTQRPGLRALINISKIDDFNENSVRQKILSALTSASGKEHKHEAYLFLIEKSLTKAEKIAKILLKKNKLRKKKIEEIFVQASQKVEPNSSIIFLGSSDWPAILAGAIASRLYYQHKKPVFVFRKGKQESQGSVRTPKDINSVELMANCADLLETYGGHARASGFRIKSNNLDKFEKCLKATLIR